LSRNFNTQAQGLSFSGIPKIIGPSTPMNGRVRVTRTLFDFAKHGRVSPPKSQASAAGADRSAVIKRVRRNVALAYARARGHKPSSTPPGGFRLGPPSWSVSRSQQRRAERVDRRHARQDTARRGTGRLIVASNLLDRARIISPGALGIDPATPITLARHAETPAGAAMCGGSQRGGRQGVAVGRPRPELARGAAARTAVGDFVRAAARLSSRPIMA